MSALCQVQTLAHDNHACTQPGLQRYKMLWWPNPVGSRPSRQRRCGVGRLAPSQAEVADGFSTDFPALRSIVKNASGAARRKTEGGDIHETANRRGRNGGFTRL